MNKCIRWQDCLHMTCYHITEHETHINCKKHECFLDGSFQKCNCVPICSTKSAIAARDKWWIERLHAIGAYDNYHCKTFVIPSDAFEALEKEVTELKREVGQ